MPSKSIYVAANGKILFLFYGSVVFHWVSLVTQTKESACNAGDPGSIPELGIYPGEGNGNPL